MNNEMWNKCQRRQVSNWRQIYERSILAHAHELTNYVDNYYVSANQTFYIDSDIYQIHAFHTFADTNF